MSKGVVNQEDVQRLTELRMIRNRQVHSSKIDSKEVEYALGYIFQTTRASRGRCH
jgi:uncharacterized protein YutE (UPF0331/DUF86 family)